MVKFEDVYKRNKEEIDKLFETAKRLKWGFKDGFVEGINFILKTR